MKKILLVMLVVMLCMVSKIIPAEAVTYKAQTIMYLEYDRLDRSALNVTGYNVTHGFTKPLDGYFTVERVSGSDYYYYFVNYILPDDGSKWEVTGMIYIYNNWAGTSRFGRFHETRTTAGTFTGVSIGKAVNAANNAKSSADTAATNAANANTNASAAKTEATAAKNAAFTASSRVWDSAEGKSAATLSKEARDRANAAAGDATYIRRLQFPRPDHSHFPPS